MNNSSSFTFINNLKYYGKGASKKSKKYIKKSKKDILVSHQLEKLNNIVSNFEKNISEFEILLKNNKIY